MKIGQKNDIFKFILILSSVFFICLFYFISLSRIAYPFELEWMEGGSVDHLERIMNGQPIYTPPSVEFIPYIYTPLYYISAIPLTKVLGLSLLPLRLVSLISTTLIMLVLFNFIKKETGKSYYGLVAAGLFSVSFSISGAWYDLARVDMLFVLLFLLAFYFLRFYKSKTGYFVAAIFASMSFLTKQTATLTILPICLYLFMYDRKKSWYFNLTFWIIVFATTIYFSLISDGWYYFWNFTLPADHSWTKKVFITFWTIDLIKPYSLMILLAVAYFYFNRKNDESRFYSMILAGGMITSWLSRLHYGGYANVLIPVYLSIIMIGVLGFAQLSEKSKETDSSYFYSFIISLALLFQFVTLTYSPLKQIPTKADEKAGWELVSLLQIQKGDVYIPGNTYYARMAGKKSFTHGLLIWDLMLSSTKYNKMIETEFNSYLRNHQFAMVIDYAGMNYPYLDSVYQKSGNAFKQEDVGWAITGFPTRPKSIYYPKK